MYIPSIVKSVEQGQQLINTAGGMVAVYTLATTVDVNNSAVEITGFTGADSNNTIAFFPTVELTSGNQVTCTYGQGVSGSVIVSFMVTQFYPGFIKSRQVVSIAIPNGSFSNTFSLSPTISNINKAKYFSGGFRATTLASSGNAQDCVMQYITYNTTTVTSTRINNANVPNVHKGTMIEFR